MQDFYTYSTAHLKKVFNNSDCPFDDGGISGVPDQMKKMWNCLLESERQKFSVKKQSISEILPAWHEINTVFFFRKILNLDYSLPENDTGPDLISEDQSSYIECKLVENPINQNIVQGFPSYEKGGLDTIGGFADTDKLALKLTNSIDGKIKQLAKWQSNKSVKQNYTFSLSLNSWLLTFNGFWFSEHIEELDKILRNVSNPQYTIYSDNKTREIVHISHNPNPDRLIIAKNSNVQINISDYKFQNLPFGKIYLNANCPFLVPSQSNYHVFKKENYSSN
jgi:hypothetical protein